MRLNQLAYILPLGGVCGGTWTHGSRKGGKGLSAPLAVGVEPTVTGVSRPPLGRWATGHIYKVLRRVAPEHSFIIWGVSPRSRKTAVSTFDKMSFGFGITRYHAKRAAIARTIYWVFPTINSDSPSLPWGMIICSRHLFTTHQVVRLLLNYNLAYAVAQATRHSLKSCSNNVKIGYDCCMCL